MTYPVETIDYSALVASMAAKGLDGMADVIAEQLGKLGKPVWANETTFFWRSLYNASRANDMVWLWLVTQPHVRNFSPAGAERYAMPGLAPEAKLPLIGGIDDTPYEARERPKQWPDDPTEGNLREQAVALDAYLKAEAESRPSNHCKCIDDYVATFYYSGSGQMLARTQLIESGFHALATEEGLRYLMETYPPEPERKKLWFVRKSIMTTIAQEFPFAKVSVSHIEADAPQSETEFNANAQLWTAVFKRLYAANESVKALPILSFWHQPPDVPAPLDHYTKREQFFKRHTRLAKLFRIAVPEKMVTVETVLIEVHDANLLFASPEELDKGIVTFCVTRGERARIEQPGLIGSFIMLPITHPCKLSAMAGAIHRIMLP
jgi:hypothetical protein